MTLRWRNVLGLTVGAAAAVVLARLFGLPELAGLAMAGWLAAVFAAISLVLRDSRPTAGVAVVPPVVERDDPARLELRLAGAAPRRGRLPFRVHARMGTAGDGILAVGRQTSVTLAIPTPQRGLVRIGPFTATTSDPLGWWRTQRDLDARAELLVRPRSVELPGWPGSSGRLPAPGGRSAGARVGMEAEEDMVGLRPYVRGDDLRRVHWRTSARRGEPHVIQVESPVRSPSVTVVLDLAPAADPTAFERAVDAAASVLTSAAGDDRPLRLAGTHRAGVAERLDSGVRTPSDLPDLLDALALVEPTRGAELPPVLERVGSPSTTVVLCTADPEVPDPGGLEPIDVVVACGDPGAAEARDPAPPTVYWNGGTPLTGAWSAAVARADVEEGL